MTAKQSILVVLTSSSFLLGISYLHDHFRGSDSLIGNNDPSSPTTGAKNQDENTDKRQVHEEDFVLAAQTALSATVHITTKISRTVRSDPPGSSSEISGSGSGVIISQDGYILTNDHVILGAEKVMVRLPNRKSLYAQVVGVDAVNDLALLKIEAQGLPFLIFGNSDQVKIGQWVLAVGYPFDLEATVTAGIVGARGGPLEIRNDSRYRLRMQSYIQSDAVINLGNSGGPLINTQGQLIGINSYLSSATGIYSGYSFSIPINIVRKIVNELIRNGKPFA
jgi:serine protease Do